MASDVRHLEDSPRNRWRAETPGVAGWRRSVRPGDPNKLFVVSTDNHANEPHDVFAARVPKEYHHRLPHVRVDDDGTQWLITEMWAPQLVRPARDRLAHLQIPEDYEPPDVFQPWTTKMEPEDDRRVASGYTLEGRLADDDEDGIDAEVIFANKGLQAFATHDADFSFAMARAWNDWAREHFGDAWYRMLPMAMVPTLDVELAVAEVQRVAELGFRGVLIPNSPLHGHDQHDKVQYNDSSFERFWSAVAETGLPIMLHVTTGKDPRGVGGQGGAIVNYVCHAVSTTMEPLAQVIASGVLERHPGLRLATVESGVGWIPWFLETMDHAYRAHHMWVRPVIPQPPSEYYRRQCFSTFMEDHAGIAVLSQFDLVDNAMWASDYPHHEGSFPHSAATIERQMQGLDDDVRARLVGSNAARLFGLDAVDIQSRNAARRAAAEQA
jgi:predicted TIM-barrel fold metal-dependent hydrolase